MSILDVHHDFIVFKKTSITQVSQLFVGKFDSNVPHSGIIKLTDCTEPQDLSGENTLTYECTEFEYDNDESISEYLFFKLYKKNIQR